MTDEPLYYVQGDTVIKRPVRTPKDGGDATVSLGFPVCTVSKYVGSDAAPFIADALNKHEASGVMDKPTNWIAELTATAVGQVRARLQEDLDSGRFMTGAPYQPSDIAELQSGIAYLDAVIADLK